MSTSVRSPRVPLQKVLGLFDVYAVGAGATLSSGFFLLPGLAAAAAGAALPLAYLLAALLLFPGFLSKTELATAMPRAGGVYYFIDRAMGPLMGSIAGFGTWISLMLKAAFALVGVGAYLGLVLPELEMGPVAAGFAVLFGAINALGAKKSSAFQAGLLVALLVLLAWFIGLGLTQVRAEQFAHLFAAGPAGLVEATGLVIVSFMGLTKVASIAEEVRNPERNIPLGLFLAFGSVLLIYVVGTAVMVGVVGVETLARNGGDLTPVATVARTLVGPWGGMLMVAAAVLAFSSVANAGILSASRYPLAMSRDSLLPARLARISGRGTPHLSIALTVAVILALVLVLDPTKIAKLAGAFMLVTFGLNCLAVIVMRESRIPSYDPGFRSPFYPWIQIVGIVTPVWMIMEMGWLASLFSGLLITFGAMWYTYYARARVSREGAIYHVFERLGRQRDEGLDRELRGILKEKGLRSADPFDEVIADALVIDLSERARFTEVLRRASVGLGARLGLDAETLEEGFLKGTAVGMTPVSHGAALPHVRIPGLAEPALALIRGAEGIDLDVAMDGLGRSGTEPVHAVFCLVSSEEQPGRHLRILAQIAGRVDDDDFMDAWLAATHPQELKEVVLRDERMLALRLLRGTPSSGLIGHAMSELAMPEGTLVALIRRSGDFVVPRGGTILCEEDRLTIIGHPDGVQALRVRFGVAAGGGPGSD